jgi:hypothetical protein
VWALGMVAGCYVLIGHLNFPPRDVNEAISWSTLALVAFVWLGPHDQGRRYMVRAVFVVALGLLTLWPIHESLHGHVQMRNLLAFFFLALGTWSIIEKVTQKVQPLTLIALPMICATALSLLLMFKGSASMAQMVSVICALLGGVLAVALVAPGRVAVAAIMPFISVFIILFMVCGHFYLDINPWFMIYLCVPYLVLWIRGVIPFIPHRPIGEALSLGVLSALPLIYFIWTVYKTAGPLY